MNACIHGTDGYCYACVWTKPTYNSMTITRHGIDKIRETFERMAADLAAANARAEAAERKAEILNVTCEAHCMVIEQAERDLAAARQEAEEAKGRAEAAEASSRDMDQLAVEMIAERDECKRRVSEIAGTYEARSWRVGFEDAIDFVDGRATVEMGDLVAAMRAEMERQLTDQEAKATHRAHVLAEYRARRGGR